ncbi:hypothetical protein [Aeromonas veronii]|uniref:hypothetical protein n=1 Tax=Aeromonas veronii TaxID=654 RepID=UPI0014317D0D|nr:hypothetical protein [Aeromonas veronii]MCO4171636.1 hypothetical protein [Aeromonas veronii]NJI11340.1 hypothetical protein [Aeromonas veronii]
MSYKSRFEAAVTKTREIGLRLKEEPYPFKQPLSFEEKRQALQLCVDVLFAHGYKTSSDLAGHCTPVHLMAQYFLKEKLGIESYITVGDRYWNDYIYCEMSYDSIRYELMNPDITKPIKAHVWLTLSDGTIIDCTAEAHADLLFERGDFPVHQCLMIVDPERVEDDVAGYHRPYLVGTDFLSKAGMC